MSTTVTRDCTDVCPVVVEIGEVEKIYDSLSKKIYTDMDRQYKEGKFNGATYADTWAKLMSSVVSGALQAVVALQNKETAADRAVKYEQVDSSIASTERNDNVANSGIIRDDNIASEQIASSKVKTTNETCIATAECALKTKQKEEIPLESARKDKTTTEAIASSKAKTTNETCIATSTCNLNTVKEKAESIKNGDSEDGTSLYGYNKEVLIAQETLYQRQKAGFSDNARQKLLDSQMSAWSIVWKDGNAIEIPSELSTVNLDSLISSTGSNIGIDVGDEV